MQHFIPCELHLTEHIINLSILIRVNLFQYFLLGIFVHLLYFFLQPLFSIRIIFVHLVKHVDFRNLLRFANFLYFNISKRISDFLTFSHYDHITISIYVIQFSIGQSLNIHFITKFIQNVGISVFISKNLVNFFLNIWLRTIFTLSILNKIRTNIILLWYKSFLPFFVNIVRFSFFGVFHLKDLTIFNYRLRTVSVFSYFKRSIYRFIKNRSSRIYKLFISRLINDKFIPICILLYKQILSFAIQNIL